jgi:hypothetical protein
MKYPLVICYLRTENRKTEFILNSEISIVTRLGAGDDGNFFPSLLLYRRLLPRGVKRPDREADHSRLSSADATNTWSYTSTLYLSIIHSSGIESVRAVEIQQH